MFKIKKNGVPAWALRLCNLVRWPLMRNAVHDDVGQHTFRVAVIAHHIAMIAKHTLGNPTVNPDRVAAMAIYHDLAESSGPGDIPHSVKYSSKEAMDLFKALEAKAERDLADSYSDAAFGQHMREYIIQDELDGELKFIVKAADIIDGFIHAAKELEGGNKDFSHAYNRQKTLLNDYVSASRAVAVFVNDYLPSCLMNLDELAHGSAE
ncbi:5'-deoxynucleotidase [Vibrio breoganii]